MYVFSLPSPANDQGQMPNAKCHMPNAYAVCSCSESSPAHPPTAHTMTSHEDGSADQPTVTLRTRPYRDGTHAPHLQLPVELSNPELADHHQLPSSHSPGLL